MMASAIRHLRGTVLAVGTSATSGAVLVGRPNAAVPTFCARAFSRAPIPAGAPRPHWPRGAPVLCRGFAAVVQKTPEFGAESITEGTVQEWKVKVGDFVNKGDLICAIETDKVTVEVNAQESGTIASLLIKVDETAAVGQPLCSISPGAAGAAPAAAAAAAAAPSAATSATAAGGEVIEIRTPEFGAESITEGTIMEWKVKSGGFAKKGDILVAIETDKVTIEVNAPENGTVTEIFIDADGTAEVGKPLCSFRTGGEAPAATPEAAAAPAAPAPAAPAPAPTSAPATVEGAAHRQDRPVKMTRMRQAIARRLKDAQNTTCMLSTFQEVDMSGLMQMRKEYKDLFEQQHGIRLGFMSAFVKACSNALLQLPAVNAVINDDTNEVVYKDYVDISVAVASPKGLVVPVLRDVQNMSMFDVEKEITDLAVKAKKEQLTLDDMTGGNFTISNGGVFGSMLGTPIINPPQSAILGMHATKERPVVLPSGEIAVRPIMYLALTYDHRLVDGREAVSFLCTVRDQVEDPRRLLLQL